MEFNSQVATNRQQSERLIALGIKKETADMYYPPFYFENSLIDYFDAKVLGGSVREEMMAGYEEYKDYIPAWSLHRLWELLGKIKKYEGEDELLYPRISLEEDNVIFISPKSIWARRNFCSTKGAYENIINCFEELIKEGYFNKEYLV